MKELTDYVNSNFYGESKSKSAIRNIFIGNNDYYKFKYITISRGKYGPAELNTSYKVIKKVARQRKMKKAGFSLSYELRASTQNPVIDSWYIFGEASEKDAAFLSYYNNLIYCEFKNIKKKNINDFMLLLDMNALAFDDELLKKYISNKNVNQKDIINAYKLLINKNYFLIKKWKIRFKQKNGILTDEKIENSFQFNDLFEKAILKAIIYAQE